jgi:ribonuclease HII
VETVIDGDALCLSVAAASIVAKVTRDRMMAAEAECYPGYDFESNRGYRSYRHRCALLGYGPTAIHRRSWVCMENLPWAQPAPELTLFP